MEGTILLPLGKPITSIRTALEATNGSDNTASSSATGSNSRKPESERTRRGSSPFSDTSPLPATPIDSTSPCFPLSISHSSALGGPITPRESFSGHGHDGAVSAAAGAGPSSSSSNGRPHSRLSRGSASSSGHSYSSSVQRKKLCYIAGSEDDPDIQECEGREREGDGDDWWDDRWTGRASGSASDRSPKRLAIVKAHQNGLQKRAMNAYGNGAMLQAVTNNTHCPLRSQSLKALQRRPTSLYPEGRNAIAGPSSSSTSGRRSLDEPINLPTSIPENPLSLPYFSSDDTDESSCSLKRRPAIRRKRAESLFDTYSLESPLWPPSDFSHLDPSGHTYPTTSTSTNEGSPFYALQQSLRESGIGQGSRRLRKAATIHGSTRPHDNIPQNQHQYREQNQSQLHSSPQEIVTAFPVGSQLVTGQDVTPVLSPSSTQFVASPTCMTSSPGRKRDLEFAKHLVDERRSATSPVLQSGSDEDFRFERRHDVLDDDRDISTPYRRGSTPGTLTGSGRGSRNSRNSRGSLTIIAEDPELASGSPPKRRLTRRLGSLREGGDGSGLRPKLNWRRSLRRTIRKVRTMSNPRATTTSTTASDGTGEYSDNHGDHANAGSKVKVVHTDMDFDVPSGCDKPPGRRFSLPIIRFHRH